MADENKQDDGREMLTVELTITRGDGVQVPATMELHYPAGHGLSAVVALTRTPDELFKALANELLGRGDAETVAAFLDMRDAEEG